MLVCIYRSLICRRGKSCNAIMFYRSNLTCLNVLVLLIVIVVSVNIVVTVIVSVIVIVVVVFSVI